MKRNLEEIRIKLKKRGIADPNREEINQWALVFILEDLVDQK